MPSPRRTEVGRVHQYQSVPKGKMSLHDLSEGLVGLTGTGGNRPSHERARGRRDRSGENAAGGYCQVSEEGTSAPDRHGTSWH